MIIVTACNTFYCTFTMLYMVPSIGVVQYKEEEGNRWHSYAVLGEKTCLTCLLIQAARDLTTVSKKITDIGKM